EPRGLRFGLGARMRDAAQLDFGGLALAGEVERALLVVRPRRRDFPGAAILLETLPPGGLQRFEELAHRGNLLALCCRGLRQLGGADFRPGSGSSRSSCRPGARLRREIEVD